jgi:TP901 family phage tail tape measure protein
MADIESNININIDANDALVTIKRLQKEISAFHTSLASGSAKAAQMQQNLINSLNATGKWSASMTNVASTTEAFTTALEKNKFSMGQYFRYAGASSKTFGKLFKSEWETIETVARERVKSLQTQYIKLGKDANGAIKSISVRPLALDLENMSTKTQMAAQKAQIFNQLMKQGSTNLLNFGKNTQWAGRQLMVGFSVPLAMMGAAASKEFMKLEEQAIRFKRVYGDTFTPTKETDAMLNQIKQVANEFTKYGVSVDKTIGLAADAAAMGKQGADLIAQVTQANKLAVLGGVDQQKSLETTTSLTNAFGVAAKDLSAKINFLNAVENQTVTSIDDLTEAIPKAGPVVRQLGGDVEDLSFFLTAMKEGGINASEGANALKSGLASMINPTKKASDFLASFNINVKGIVDNNKGDVKGMVLSMASALNTLDPTNRARAIEQLFGKFQFSRMSTLFQNVIKEGSQAQRVLTLTHATTQELAVLSEREMKKISDSPMYKFQKAVEQLQVSLAPVGEAFLKAVTPIVEFGKTILDKFNGMSDGAKNFVVILTAVVAGIGPALLMTFGLIANGAANIVKLFLGLTNMFKRLGGSSNDLGSQLSYMTQEQLDAAAASASLEQSHNRLRQSFTSEANAVKALVAEYERATAAQARFSGIPMGRTKTPAKKLASGGILNGPGTGTSDSIPAMLSNGEAVIPAKHVAKNRGLVQALISGNIPGFASGGIVGNPLIEIFKRFKNSKNSKMAPTDFGQLISASTGHSFPDFPNNPHGIPSMGGLYKKPDGSLSFVKPQMDERGAIAELRATQIAREAHGLLTPEQKLRVMKDISDPSGKRKFYALESPYDEKFANPTGKFTKEEAIKQLVASLLRGDKDLSQSNLFSNRLADVGTSGVFTRASGFREFAPQMPSMEEQAMVNLLGVKGGAKRAFAENTADIARQMSAKEYHEAIVSEINGVLPKLEKTIASFGLTDPDEIKAYQNMVNRLKEGKNVDWSKFHGIHSAVQPKPQKLSNVTKKPGAVGYDFDDTLIDLSSFLPGHRAANEKLPKEQRKSWGWSAIKGAKPMTKVIENLLSEQASGKKIVIMTARPNTMDKMTIAHLKELGIDPANVKLISRNILDKKLSGLSTAELKAIQAKNVMDEYDLEAFFDDMEDNRNAVANLGVKVFDPLKFASGSHMVPGSGNKDTVPAMLTPGEAVIPKKQAERYRPLIKGMIAGNVPGFADGKMPWDMNEPGRARRASIQQNIEKISSKGFEKEIEVVKDELIKFGATTKQARDLFAHMNAAASNGKEELDKWMAELNKNAKEVSSAGELIKAQKLSTGAGKSKVSTNFTHIGSGVQMTPEEFINQPGFSELTQAQQNAIQKIVGTEKKISVKSSLGMDNFSDVVNRKLALSSSAAPDKLANISEFKNAFDAAGIEKWNSSVIAGGGNVAELGKDIKKFDNDFKKLLDKIDPATKIFDSAAQAEDYMSKNAGKAAVSLEQLYATVIQGQSKDLVSTLSTAHITGREVRIGGSGKKQKVPAPISSLLVNQAKAELQTTKYEESLSPQQKAAATRKANREAKLKAEEEESARVKAQARSDAARKGWETRKAKEQAAKEQATEKKPGILSKAKGLMSPGKLFGAGMVATTAVGAASMVSGPIGEAAQNIMPVVSGISMLAPMLPMLANPVGAVIGGLVALGAVAVGLKMAFDGAMNKAIDFGDKLGVGTNAMTRLAEFSGKVTGSEQMDKKREEQMALIQGIGVKDLGLGGQFLESDPGKAMLTSLTDAAKSTPMADIGNMIYDQMATGIATGAIDEKTAKSIVVALGEKMKDPSMAIGVNTKLVNTFGPNGEKLGTAQGRSEINAQLSKDSRERMAAANERFNNPQADSGTAALNVSALAVTTVGAALAPVTGGISLAVAGIYDLVAGTIEGVQAMQKLGETSGAVAANGVMALQQNQALLDSLDLEYQKRIQTAKAAGDLAKAEKLQNEYSKERANLLEENKKTLEVSTSAYDQANKENNGIATAAMGQAVDKAIETTYANDPLMQQAAIATRGQIASAGGLNNTQEYTMKLMLATGDISPQALSTFLTNFGENGAVMNSTMNVMSNLGTAEGSQIVSMVNTFVNPDGTPNTNLQAKFMAQFDGKSTTEAKEIADFYTKVQTSGGDIQATMDLSLNNPGKFQELKKSFKDLDDLTQGGTKKVTYEQVAKKVGDIAGLKENAEWFNNLSPVQQTYFVQHMLTVSANITDSQLDDYIHSHTKFTPGGAQIGKTMTKEQARAGIMKDEAKNLKAMMDSANSGINNNTNNSSSNSGGGGGSATTELERLQAQLQLIAKDEDKINKKYDERLKALDEIQKLNEQISAQQKDQLDLADALTKGDMAAAARATQQMRQNDAQREVDRQKTALENARQSELSSVKYKGKTRSWLENRINYLETIDLRNTANGTKKAGGGLIKGPGTGTSDSIPAMLSTGEYVVRADAVKQLGTGMLDRINNADKKKFSMGGLVSPSFYAAGGTVKPNSSKLAGSSTTSAINNLMNSGAAKSNKVYNYSISVNAATNANPNEIARVVMNQISNIESRQVRGNYING